MLEAIFEKLAKGETLSKEEVGMIKSATETPPTVTDDDLQKAAGEIESMEAETRKSMAEEMADDPEIQEAMDVSPLLKSVVERFDALQTQVSVLTKSVSAVVAEMRKGAVEKAIAEISKAIKLPVGETKSQISVGDVVQKGDDNEDVPRREAVSQLTAAATRHKSSGDMHKAREAMDLCRLADIRNLTKAEIAVVL